jgi:hypothetical protein
MVSKLALINYVVLFFLLYICIMPDRISKNSNPLKRRTTGQSPVVPFSEGTDALGFMHSWINSEQYLNRLKQNQYQNPEFTQNARSRSLESVQIDMQDIPSQASGSPTLGSRSYINLNPQNIKDVGYNTLLSHELGHVAGAVPEAENRNIGFNPFEENIIKQSRVNPSQNPHDRMPKEMKADLDSNRFNLFNKGVYDIREGNPFTQEHLDKSKEFLKDDHSFQRLLEQTGDDNYIEMMNKIAMNNTETQFQAKYGGRFNPVSMDYSWGGMMEQTQGSSLTGMGAGMLSQFIPQQNKNGFTSIGGSAASGALKGASMGAAFGPIGMGVGALIGGVGSAMGAKKQQREEMEQYTEMSNLNSRNQLASMNYGQAQASNLPMAMGGSMNPLTTDTPLNSYSYFTEGGTHESNPYGGIPQGQTNQGTPRTVEAGEGKFKFSDGDYIFSNRLKLD